MPESEVAELLSSDESICVRIRRRADGSVITADTKATRRRPFFHRAIALVAGVVSLITFSGCDRTIDNFLESIFPQVERHGPDMMGRRMIQPKAVMGEVQRPMPRELMGKIAPPTIPAINPDEKREQ